MLHKFAPEVFWICGSHDANVSVSIDKPDPAFVELYKTTYHSAYWDGVETTSKGDFYKVVENIQSFLIGGESRKGWKARGQVLLCTPRTRLGQLPRPMSTQSRGAEMSCGFLLALQPLTAIL